MAKQALKDLELNYVNFPIEDCHWTTSSLEDITRFLHATRSGDFYVGCANGQARTDLAVAINYILNPDSKTLPKLYFGSTSATRISIKENFNDILKVIDKKPDIISDWGWNNYPEFKQEVTKRLEKLVLSLSCG